MNIRSPAQVLTRCFFVESCESLPCYLFTRFSLSYPFVSPTPMFTCSAGLKSSKELPFIHSSCCSATFLLPTIDTVSSSLHLWEFPVERTKPRRQMDWHGSKFVKYLPLHNWKRILIEPCLANMVPCLTVFNCCVHHCHRAMYHWSHWYLLSGKQQRTLCSSLGTKAIDADDESGC